MMTRALNGADRSTPTTACAHFAAAGRVTFQPVIMTGSGATQASRIRLMSRAASMPARARTARKSTTSTTQRMIRSYPPVVLTIVPMRFDTMLSPNGSDMPTPFNGTVRILCVICPTMPSMVIITLMHTAVNGHASTAIAKLLITSATLPLAAACKAPMTHNAMFTNPMIQPIRFAAVMATFHSSLDMLPTRPLKAPVNSWEHRLSNGLNSQSIRFARTVWMMSDIWPPSKKEMPWTGLARPRRE